MHHLFITPVVAGVLTAGVIALSPSFDDPYEASFSDEEPVIDQTYLDIVAGIATPAEPTGLPHGIAAERPVRVAMFSAIAPDTRTDMPYQRHEFAVAPGPIAEDAAIPARADAPLLAVAIKRLNMRAGPGTTYVKLGVLKYGTKLEETGNAKGPWLEVAVASSGQTGWLHSKYLTKAQ